MKKPNHLIYLYPKCQGPFPQTPNFLLITYPRCVCMGGGVSKKLSQLLGVYGIPVYLQNFDKSQKYVSKWQRNQDYKNTDAGKRTDHLNIYHQAKHHIFVTMNNHKHQIHLTRQIIKYFQKSLIRPTLMFYKPMAAYICSTIMNNKLKKNRGWGYRLTRMKSQYYKIKPAICIHLSHTCKLNQSQTCDSRSKTLSLLTCTLFSCLYSLNNYLSITNIVLYSTGNVEIIYKNAGGLEVHTTMDSMFNCKFNPQCQNK